MKDGWSGGRWEGTIRAGDGEDAVDVDCGVGGVCVRGSDVEAAGGDLAVQGGRADGEVAGAECAGSGGEDVADDGGAAGVGVRGGDGDAGELGAGGDVVVVDKDRVLKYQGVSC